MKTAQAALLLLPFIFSLNRAYAINPVDPTTMASCAALMDETAEKEEPKKLGHVRNFINMTALKNYRPVPRLHQSAIGVLAFGNIDPELLQNLPNFVAYQFQTCPIEAEELCAKNVEKMIEQFFPKWFDEKIWFFEVTDPISLMKRGSNLPTQFQRDSYVIMKDAYPIGQAFLGEIDRIEWF